jgi:murein DD-endopeptidase MepM/ murein hydrolase activator NlpD
MSSKFGARNAAFTGRKSNHHGVDIASPMGSPILSMDDGVITFTGKKTGYGILVEVNHSQGYATRTPPRLRLQTSFLVAI